MASRAAIVGASVAGLASACSLAARGWSVTVVERRGDLLEGGRAILLQPNGLAALDRLGALDAVRRVGRELTEVVFYLGRTREAARYDYSELREPHPYLIEIRPGDLRSALAERLEELGAEPPRLGRAATELIRDNGGVAGVRTGDEELRADLVVGADGPASLVREALGVPCRRFAESDGYVLGTPSAEPESTELEVYCGSGYANGVVPLREGTYFWDCVTDENRAAVQEGDLEGWREVFARRLRPGSGLPRAIESWDELTVVRVRPFWARELAVDGAVLAGDAAGTVHPHSAQGANLALEDAVALGENDIRSYVRSRHRRRRQFVLWSLLAAANMDAPNPVWRALRRSGFAWARVGPVRRALVRRQAGA